MTRAAIAVRGPHPLGLRGGRAGQGVACLAAVILLVLAVAPVSATASTAFVSKATTHDPLGRRTTTPIVVVRAASGERNRIVISRDVGRETISDRVPLHPGRGCVQDGDSHRVICHPTGDSGDEPPPYRVFLGDEADRFGIRLSRELTRDDPEGPQNPQNGAEVYAGAGDDIITGGPGRSILDGGPGDDRIRGRSDGDVYLMGSSRDGSDTVILRSEASDVDYSSRRRPLRLSLDGRRNDGERGERDNLIRRGGAVSLIGGHSPDRLWAGKTTHDSAEELNRVGLAGGGGADVLIGNGSPNELYANTPASPGRGRDADRLFGRGGPDSLYGNAGPNLLVGGNGTDLIDAGRGDDTVRVRDHDLDGVQCGDGHDLALLDVFDTLASRHGCETLARPTPAIATFDVFDSFSAGSLDGNEEDDGFYVGMVCPADGPRVCRGRLRLNRRSKTLATRTFAIRRGHSKQPLLRLTRDGEETFRRLGGILYARLQIRTRDRYGRLRVATLPPWYALLQIDV